MPVRGDALTLFQPVSLGRGIVEVFSGVSPAAGANFTRTTAQGYAERLVGLTWQVVTDATAANRNLSVVYQDADTNPFALQTAPNVQTATTTVVYGATIGGSAAGVLVGGRMSLALPPLILFPGHRFVIQVSNIQVTDAITAIRGLVERFSLGADGYPVGETELPYTERGRGYVRGLESE